MINFLIAFYFLSNAFLMGQVSTYQKFKDLKGSINKFLVLIVFGLLGNILFIVSFTYNFLENFLDDILLLDWLKVFFTNTYENLNERACIKLGDACQRKGIKTLHGKSFNLLCRFINYKYDYRIKHC